MALFGGLSLWIFFCLARLRTAGGLAVASGLSAGVMPEVRVAAGDYTIDALIDIDRDNMCYIDIFEVDGNRTSWRAAGRPGRRAGRYRKGAGRAAPQRIPARTTL